LAAKTYLITVAMNGIDYFDINAIFFACRFLINILINDKNDD